MQNSHGYRFLAAERVRELQREARSSHLTDARLRFILSIWLSKICAAFRRRSVGAAIPTVQVLSYRSVQVGCDG